MDQAKHSHQFENKMQIKQNLLARYREKTYNEDSSLSQFLREGGYGKTEENNFPKKSRSYSLEDRALKEAARLFGEELMPLLGIQGKA